MKNFKIEYKDIESAIYYLTFIVDDENERIKIIKDIIEQIGEFRYNYIVDKIKEDVENYTKINSLLNESLIEERKIKLNQIK